MTYRPSPEDLYLAAALRQRQWELDDAAHKLPVGRLPHDQRQTLADLLEALAGALRAHPAQDERAG